MKTKMLMASGFLAVAGIAIVAYAAWASSNQNHLNSEQVNFNGLRTVHHQHQLKDVAMWDTMLNKITAWAQNHESRLQARASSSADYPNLTSADTSFTHLIDARKSNGNKLTEQMWDGLQTQLSKVALNHEMRLRMQASQPTQPTPGNAMLVITNPLDMVFGAGESGSSYARELKVQGVNISLQENDPRLRYYSKNTAIIQTYGDDTQSYFVPTSPGAAQICAYVMENGQKIEACTVAVVGVQTGGGNSGGGNASGGVINHCSTGKLFGAAPDSRWDSWLPNLRWSMSFFWTYDATAQTWQNKISLSIDSIQRDRAGSVWQTKMIFRIPQCIWQNYNMNTLASIIRDWLNRNWYGGYYEVEAVGANGIMIEQVVVREHTVSNDVPSINFSITDNRNGYR